MSEPATKKARKQLINNLTGLYLLNCELQEGIGRTLKSSANVLGAESAQIERTRDETTNEVLFSMLSVLLQR